MATGIEKEIQNLLRILPHKNQVADELLKKWHRGVLSNKEVDDVAAFLFKIGFHKSLASEINYHSEKKSYLPVEYCIKLIDHYADTLVLDEDWINSIYLWAEASGTSDILIRMNKLIQKDKRFAKLRELAIDTDLGHRQRQLQVDLRSLQALLVDGLWPEAENIANKILIDFPENKEAEDALKKLRFEQALETLKKQKNKDSSSLDQISYSKSGDDDKQVLATKKHLLDLAKKEPSWNYDLSIALFSIGFHQEALDLLEKDTSYSSFLLRMEILLEERKFFIMIEELESYAKKHQFVNNDSEFAISYLYAKALWGAGENKKAIEQMENILKYRPDYRIAENLVREWTKVSKL